MDVYVGFSYIGALHFVKGFVSTQEELPHVLVSFPISVIPNKATNADSQLLFSFFSLSPSLFLFLLQTVLQISLKNNESTSLEVKQGPVVLRQG